MTATSNEDHQGVRIPSSVVKPWAAIGQPIKANGQVLFKRHLINFNGSTLALGIPPPYLRPLMQPFIRGPWSPHSSGRLSPSISATASEEHYDDDADDELTTSEDMSRDATSDLQDSRPRSPPRSDGASVYSYSSSVDHLTRDIHGRKLNNVNDSYMLPGIYPFGRAFSAG
ncbi:hypothetical protein M407DRAFT_18616 [Tulasnella calospora MUT 4182]|uniref:Uncharacterized protein n=1 Tax=Tulasnella calospora MUT 4182 TaxID=1051891 RepID=A0A0C3QVC4_9AGAM|nr:hypothetical protein M407DRAFT_18616 [Tulasnella calospora MUT 4182]